MTFIKKLAIAVGILVGAALVLVGAVVLWWALAARCTPFGPSWWC